MNIWDIIISVLIVCAIAFAVVGCIKRRRRGCCCTGSDCGCCNKCKK